MAGIFIRESDYMRRVAMNGNLEALKIARLKYNCIWNTSVCSGATLNGHLEVLKWAREDGCPWNTSTCANAALNGHFEVLKWAYENGCPWNTTTCANAALGGHLEILQWARENGCPWNSMVYANAARRGHVHILNWAFEHQCPMGANVGLEAVLGGKYEAFIWSAKGKHGIHLVYLTDVIKGGSIDILKYYIRNYAQPKDFNESILSDLIRQGRTDMLRVIIEHYPSVKFAPEYLNPQKYYQDFEWILKTCNIVATTEQIKWLSSITQGLIQTIGVPDLCYVIKTYI